jgi:hypothetical protein
VSAARLFLGRYREIAAFFAAMEVKNVHRYKKMAGAAGDF